MLIPVGEVDPMASRSHDGQTSLLCWDTSWKALEVSFGTVVVYQLRKSKLRGFAKNSSFLSRS
jgi:hypothetical protein